MLFLLSINSKVINYWWFSIIITKCFSVDLFWSRWHVYYHKKKQAYQNLPMGEYLIKSNPKWPHLQLTEVENPHKYGTDEGKNICLIVLPWSEEGNIITIFIFPIKYQTEIENMKLICYINQDCSHEFPTIMTLFNMN